MLPWTLRRWLGFPDPEPDREGVAAAPTPRPPNMAYHHDLAMAVRASPGDDLAYRAYAAWLCENNDPRGGLIEAMLAGEPAVLEPHQVLFLGPLAFERGAEVTWSKGFWHTITVNEAWDPGAVPSLLAEALVHPSALVLHTLVVRADAIAALADTLADGPLLPIRTLRVSAEGGSLGTWAAVWARVPGLEVLELAGDNPQLGELALDLRELAVGGRLSAEALWSVARMNAPNLERLSLSDLSADSGAARRIRERFSHQLEWAGCSS